MTVATLDRCRELFNHMPKQMDTHKMIRMEYCSSALHLQKSCSNHGQTHRGNAIVERCSAKHFRRVPPVNRCPISHETLLDPADWQLTLVLSKITRLLDFLNITFGDSYRELTEVSGLGCSILYFQVFHCHEA